MLFSSQGANDQPAASLSQPVAGSAFDQNAVNLAIEQASKAINAEREHDM